MMARLIAMGVLPDETRGIATTIEVYTRLISEQVVERLLKFPFAAHHRYQIGNVLRHKKSILPSIAFGIGMHAHRLVGIGIERLHPFALLVFSTEETRLSIIEIAIEMGSPVKVSIVGSLSQGFR